MFFKIVSLYYILLHLSWGMKEIFKKLYVGIAQAIGTFYCNGFCYKNFLHVKW